MLRRSALAVITALAGACSSPDTAPRELVADVLDATTAECPNGGRRIVFGYDDDGDGALDAAEITDTAVVCDGAPGADGTSPLVWRIATADEPPGEACPHGGLRVSTGVDTNDDGNLDDEEATDVRFVCSGAAADVRIDGERLAPGAECSAGGLRLSSYRDANADGVAQPNEIVDEIVLCDPARAIVRTSSVAEGSSPCPRGGVRLDVGLDDDADGELEETEIDQTTYACNGAAPTRVEVRAEPPGANCAQGGHAVEVGEDRDEDGVLDAGEIEATSYLCAGAAGAGRTAVRVDVEPPGAQCLYGGHALRTGPDDDGDGALDPSEVTNTTYLCHAAALSSLVAITAVAPGATCPQGGQRIDAGLDTNGDLTLDASEISSSATICAGGAGPGGVQILTTALSPARVREPYGAEIAVAQGTAAYTWTITAGALPPGLRLVTTTPGAGRIEGMPNTPGVFAFTVQVTDASGGIASRALQIDVASELFLGTGPLPTAEVGQVYTATITAVGGGAPYVWSIAAGTLPAGLSIAPSGATLTIQGTPTERRTTTVQIAVTSQGATASAPFTLGFAPQWIAYEREDIFSPVLWELGLTFIGAPTPGPSLDISGMRGTLGLVDYPRSVGFSPTQERLFFIPTNQPLQGVTLSGSTASTPVPLHAGTTPGLEPLWSPTGAHLLYEQRVSGNIFEVYTVATTPTGFAAPVRAHPQLAAGVTAGTGAWSPDGTIAVFYVADLPDAQLFVDDVTDPAPGVPLFGMTDFAYAPSFSPDSRYVYFTADLDTVGQNELYRVDLAGAMPAPPQRLSGSMITLGDVDDYALSPAGDRLFFIADAITDGQRQLFVVDLAPTVSAPRLVSHVAPGSGREVYEAWWSPDGRAIAFAGDLGADGVYELYLVGAAPNATPPFVANAPMVAGGDVASSTFPRIDDVAWAPDGSRLFYIADAVTPNREELWAVDLRGVPVVEPVSQQGATSPDVESFAITPDGRFVRYANINGLDAARSITGPTLPPPIVPNDFVPGRRHATFLRDGRIVVTTNDGAHLVELSSGTVTRIAGPAANGETYLWSIAPP